MQKDIVSIIIPMRNEEGFVARCLDSVLGQLGNLPECEVLCIDGASTDRTRSIVAEYAKRDPRIRLIDNPRKIVPVSMNLGIRESRGDVIIRLDCHAEYAPDYLRSCLEVLQRTGADNVGGYVETASDGGSATGRAIAAVLASRFGVGGSAFRIGGGEQEVDTVPFGCFRRSAFDRFGGYDERLVRNQDIELNARIRRGGGRIVISPEIRLKYFSRRTFAGLRQQAFANGLWNPYTLYLTGGGLGVRHFVPLGFVTSLGLLLIGGFFFRALWWALAAEALVYLVVAGAMALRESRQTKAAAMLMLLSFAQLHLAYGIGSFCGLLTGPLRFGLHPKRQRSQDALAIGGAKRSK